MLRTGITWKRGRYVWYATIIYRGRTLSRTGESRNAAIKTLETALNRIASNPVYLFNF